MAGSCYAPIDVEALETILLGPVAEGPRKATRVKVECQQQQQARDTCVPAPSSSAGAATRDTAARRLDGRDMTVGERTGTRHGPYCLPPAKPLRVHGGRGSLSGTPYQATINKKTMLLFLRIHINFVLPFKTTKSFP